MPRLGRAFPPSRWSPPLLSLPRGRRPHFRRFRRGRGAHRIATLLPRCVRVLAAPMAAIARRCPGPRSSDWTRRAAASRSEKLWCCSDSPLSLKILSAWISANSSAPKASLFFTQMEPSFRPPGSHWERAMGLPPPSRGPPSSLTPPGLLSVGLLPPQSRSPDSLVVQPGTICPGCVLSMLHPSHGATTGDHST